MTAEASLPVEAKGSRRSSARKWLIGVTVLTAVAGVTAGGIRLAAAEPPQPHIFIEDAIYSAVNRSCLNVSGGGTDNGTPIISYPWCDPDANTNERWAIKERLGKGGYTIVLIGTNKCIDADTNTSPAFGTRVQLWDCNGSNTQAWDPAPGPDTFRYVLVNRLATDRDKGLVVLEVDSSTSAVYLAPYTGRTDQLWGGIMLNVQFDGGGFAGDAARMPSDATPIGSAMWPNRCVDAMSSQKARDGGIVQFYNCLGNTNQGWQMGSRMSDTPYGEIRLSNGMCLEADPHTSEIQTAPMQVWHCLGQDQQLWAWVRGVGGTFLLVNKAATEADGRLVVLDTTSGSNRARLILERYNWGPSQKWTNDVIKGCHNWTYWPC